MNIHCREGFYEVMEYVIQGLSITVDYSRDVEAKGRDGTRYSSPIQMNIHCLVDIVKGFMK